MNIMNNEQQQFIDQFLVYLDSFENIPYGVLQIKNFTNVIDLEGIADRVKQRIKLRSDRLVAESELARHDLKQIKENRGTGINQAKNEDSLNEEIREMQAQRDNLFIFTLLWAAAVKIKAPNSDPHQIRRSFYLHIKALHTVRARTRL